MCNKRRRTLFLLLLLAAQPGRVLAQGTFNLLGGHAHPELTWLTYDTTNFRVVFPRGLEETAKRAGSIAEQAYAVQRKNLSLGFKKRHYIFLSDRDQIPNAGTSPFGYTFIYVNPPRYLTLFSSSAGWLEQVIPHELVHALLFENTRGWLSSFLPFAGGSIPREINEGMAQFYGGERWGVERGDRYLNLLVRDYQTRPDPLALDAGQGTYAAGFAKIKWLRQTLSDEDIGRIFSSKPGQARFNFERSFRQVTGRPYGDEEERWKRAINVFYNWRAGTAERAEVLGPALQWIEADRLLVLKRSPRGDGTAFSGLTSRQAPDFALYYYDEREERVRRLAQKNIRDNFSFDPSGRRIAFTRWHSGAHADLVADIYLVDVRTGQERALTTNMRALEPVFVGPDAIVFIKQDGLISNFFRLSLAEGAVPEKLSHFSTEYHFADLSASPDGTAVLAAFVRPQDRSQGILVLDVTAMSVVEIPQPAICRFPLFAPHGGREVLFTSEEDGVLNVHRLDLATGLKTTVTKQADSVLVTDWRDERRAIGIRQFAGEKTEAFSLDPYRQPQSFPAELQPYYRKWRESEPGTRMVIDDREVPGQFGGTFRALSTMRLLGFSPNLALIKSRPALGLVGLAADMPGGHLLAVDVLSDLGTDGRFNGGASYVNRTTRFDVSARAGYHDVTTFAFYGKDDLYEGVLSARTELSGSRSSDRHYGTHRVHVGAQAQRSEVLSPPAERPVEAAPASSALALGYQLGSVFADYRFTEVQPYASFPLEGTGAAVSYQYDMSLAGREYSSHTLGFRAYRLQPFARGRVSLFASAEFARQSGALPAQLRLGMTKYSSSNSVFEYSKQIYVRGGQGYVAGNRLFTGTTELQLPSLRLLEPLLFVDASRVWEGGTSAAGSDTNLLAAGTALRMPPVLGSSLELGFAKPLSGISPRGWQFYLTVHRILPFQ